MTENNNETNQIINENAVAKTPDTTAEPTAEPRAEHIDTKGSLFNTKMLVTLALLIAMEIVLNRFLSINAWNLKIGFSFVPVVLAAMLFGPIHAAIVGGVGDLVGALLFPIGAYFPGFTLTAALMGLVWGLFLHKKHNLTNTVISVAINQLILGLFLNTYWISVLYGSAYWPLFDTRILQAGILLLVQVIVIAAMGEFVPRLKKYIF